MLESSLIQSTSSWPFVEVRKLLKDRKSIIEKKNKITLQIQAGDNDAGLFSTVKLSTDASKSILQDLLKFSLDNKAFKMSSNEVTLKDMKFSISQTIFFSLFSLKQKF